MRTSATETSSLKECETSPIDGVGPGRAGASRQTLGAARRIWVAGTRPKVDALHRYRASDGSVAPATPPLHPAKPRGEVGYDPLSNPRAREMTISARKRVNRIRRMKNRRRCGATRTFAICAAAALRARNIDNYYYCAIILSTNKYLILSLYAERPIETQI